MRRYHTCQASWRVCLWRAREVAYQGSSLDDCLTGKLLGPRRRTVAEFDVVAGGSSSREDLTPFSRKCACLWRQLYGARFDHRNPAVTGAANLKRAASRGPLRRATVGVLAAARLAVKCKRARALPVQRCILAQARFGALGGMMRCRSSTDVLWATSPA